MGRSGRCEDHGLACVKPLERGRCVPCTQAGLQFCSTYKADDFSLYRDPNKASPGGEGEVS